MGCPALAQISLWVQLCSSDLFLLPSGIPTKGGTGLLPLTVSISQPYPRAKPCSLLFSGLLTVPKRMLRLICKMGQGSSLWPKGKVLKKSPSPQVGAKVRRDRLGPQLGGGQRGWIGRALTSFLVCSLPVVTQKSPGPQQSLFIQCSSRNCLKNGCGTQLWLRRGEITSGGQGALRKDFPSSRKKRERDKRRKSPPSSTGLFFVAGNDAWNCGGHL